MKLSSLLPALLFPVLVAATASAQPGDISDPLLFRPQPFDVLHYDADIDLTAAPEPVIGGVVEISVRWVPLAQGPYYFAFHLRSLVIDSAWYEGEAVSVATIGDVASATYHHRIVPPAGATPGDTVRIRIAYHGRMTDELGPANWGGVGSSDNVLYAMGVGFMNNYVSATQHWLPCYDHPSDKATFRARFRTLDSTITASNGVLTTSAAGDTAIYEWSTAIPTATYLLTFAAGAYVPLDFGSDPVPMVVYSQRRDTADTRASFRLLPRMVRSFAERFIPYPFEKVGYVNTSIGAMEHQTMVSYPTSLNRRRDSVNRIAAHELAHQWFGDLVTPTDFRHVWLTEAFATYCESLWDEEIGGSDRYLKSQESKINNYLSQVALREGVMPLYDFPRASPSSNYPETIYQKGAAVVGMLRYEMGDSAFFKALREYLTMYAYGVATTEELRAILERHHGSSLGWFFDQWVYGKGWPQITLRVSTEELGGSYSRVTVAIDQSPIGDQRVYRRLAIPLELDNTSDAIPPETRIVTLDDASGTFVLDSVQSGSRLRANRGQGLRSLVAVLSISGVAAAADSGTIEFFVKPNPSDGSAALTVQVRGVEECTGVRYELFESTGRRLGTGSSDRCEFAIPTDGIASGAYVLRFRFREVFYDVSVVVAR